MTSYPGSNYSPPLTVIILFSLPTVFSGKGMPSLICCLSVILNLLKMSLYLPLNLLK